MKLEGLTQEIESAHLLDMQRQYESGAGASVLFKAIRFCGDQEIPLPYWANEAFQRATIGWGALRYCSLDEAFNAAAIPETTRRNRQSNSKIEAIAWSEISRLKASNKPIPWESLAKSYGVSVRKLQDMYYSGRLSQKFKNKNSRKN